MSAAVEFARVSTPKQDNLAAVAAYKKKFANEIKSDPYSILLRSSYGTAGIKTEVGVNYFKYNVAGLKLLTVKQAVERSLLDMEPYKSKRSQIYYLSVKGEKKTVHLKVQFVKELNFNDLIKYTQLKNYTTDFQETAEYTNALVSVVGTQVLQNNQVVGIGANKFFLIDKSVKTHELDKGLYLLMGTFASVRCSFNNIQNGDAMNVLDLIAEFLNIKGIPTEKDIRRSEIFLKGVKIYRQYLNRATPKAIQGFNFKDNSETLKFKDSEDKLVTVQQYFKERWSFTLKYPKLPLIKIGPEAYLPMELALITMEKAKLIAGANNTLFQKQVDFGSIDKKFTVVPARVLNAPTIEYAKNKNETRKGNWNLLRFEFVQAAKAKPYLFGICLLKDASVNAHKIGQFVNNKLDFRRYSIDLNHPSVQTQAGLEASLTGVVKRAKLQDNVFTEQRGGNFDTMTYAQMAMKINIKLGGSNHKLSTQDSAGLVDKNNVPVFILGADVTHPTGEQNEESVSIASCVGSEDALFNRFPGSIRIQSGGQEMIKDIKGMVLERLENFHNKVKKLPSKVLFYRDGVSEGQYYTVLKEELSKIKAAFAEYGKSKKKNAKDPKTNREVAVQSNDNVIPGTTVDKDITSQAYFDFYIQSQQALQGTGVPAHYYVLHDENNYTRATKSVKIVPAAYYADLLCTRGRDYIHGFAKDTSLGSTPIERANAKLGTNVAPSLRNTMFYI
ncbi:Protein argonaute PNH1 [Candida viswanathii]|uniref:Protein argonaute PNH1 n=1 Tax=Candida viswanathii TaxID=5486 RepID=A0A367XR79_9ASCO|nr:Protein argonaute PNH1 [Candida viswanathii]